MTKPDEMWAALAAYQPQADAAGHGESWGAMCQLRTVASAYAAGDDAYDAAGDAAYAALQRAAHAHRADQPAADAAKIWAQRAIDHISKVLKVAEPPAQQEPVVLRETLAAALTSTYVCGRVWSAWGIGTMSQDDFIPASECDELLDELVSSVNAATPQPTAMEPLTVEQASAALKASGYGDASVLEQVAFMVGLRHGEFAHGIKENP